MRDYGKEIDQLREEIAGLRAMIEKGEPERHESRAARPKPYTEECERVHIMHNMHPDKRLSELMVELGEKAEAEGSTGRITYLGMFASGGRQSNWIKKAASCDDLMRLAESGMAGKVLACIGNATRLKILVELLKSPKTVAELTEACGLGSTGQAYHHMKPLLAADVIVENADDRGQYFVQPHRVQGIIMLLAGISDMVDEQYTKGVWE